ncbi:MAG: peptidoglycan DD-metalloendopeptidase family protein [Sporichthyaceae bacterium]
MTIRRLRATSAVAAVALAVSLPGAEGTAFAAASVDTAHPFSDPVWWPLRTPGVVDCTKSNPGCSKHHHFYGIAVLSKDRDDTNVYNKTAGVYAMGAGIVHMGDAKGRACGQKYDSTTFGKWVWIDHGGGVISRYAHLSTISVKEGQRVSPDTRLGTVGNTGIANPANCHIHYVTFGLKFPGIYGPSAGREFSTSTVGAANGRLYACGLDGRRQTWPEALKLPGSPTRIEALPKKTVLPATGNACRSGAPKTTAKPTGVKLATAGSGALKATWTKPSTSSGVDKVRLELGEYHPSTSSWDKEKRERWKDLSATTGSYTFKELTHRKRWRVRVWFHTKAGWSAPSSWVERTTT